ncbi:hypothetical protein OG235_24505 [Streptomyces sp. NBC_00024]|uniref:hypothetical protein n=1 Tax=Streptomyces sp. NBC_00024 TaxID=2903612 RepID=UPI00324D1014
MNLIELALTTYTEGTAHEAERAEEYAAAAREELLRFARACASSTLSADAADLDWQVTTEGLPKEMEEARALLVPGRPEYLRYRINHAASPDVEVSFELVQPCQACGNDRISLVTSLFHLGALLHQDPHPADEEDQAPKEEPGPLLSVQVLEVRAVAMTGLAQRLRAEHPDAGLTVTNTSLFGHHDGDTSATLHLEATSVNAARAVAAALGTDLATRFVDHGAPYPAVLEHAKASAIVDGIDVELTAFTKLSDDEAAAWHAQQNQATEGGESE